MWEKIKKTAAKIVAAAKAVFAWCGGAVKRPYGTALWVACINCCLCFVLPNVPLLVAGAAVLLVIFNSILYFKYKNGLSEEDDGA